MKQRIQGIIIGIIITSVISGGISAAAGSFTVWRSVSVAYGNYRVVIDGEEFIPKDAYGNVIALFNKDGWIFGPFEHLARALGIDADWDGSAHILYLGRLGRSGGTVRRVPLSVAAPFYDSGSVTGSQPSGFAWNRPDILRIETQNNVAMGGRIYNNAIVYQALYQPDLSTSRHSVGLTTQFTLHNLDGRYRLLTGYAGRVDGTAMIHATLNIYGDGRLLKTRNLNAPNLPVPISVFVEDVRLLRIEFIHTSAAGADVTYAFAGFVE